MARAHSKNTLKSVIQIFSKVGYIGIPIIKVLTPYTYVHSVQTIWLYVMLLMLCTYKYVIHVFTEVLFSPVYSIT